MLLISLISSITLCICLNVINQKSDIIFNQDKQITKANSQISTYQKVNNNNQNTIMKQENKIKSLSEQLTKNTIELNQVKDANKHLKYLGKFKVTYYDLSYESCNKYPNDPAYGHTYSGAIAKEGVTIAVDKSIIPLGSYVYINQTGCRIAEDIGGAIKGNHIDVFVQNFSYKKYKTHYTDVYLIQ